MSLVFGGANWGGVGEGGGGGQGKGGGGKGGGGFGKSVLKTEPLQCRSTIGTKRKEFLVEVDV